MVMKCHKIEPQEALAGSSTYQGWIVQMKLDGSRTLFKNGTLESSDRVGCKAERYPHILSELNGYNVELDGELHLPNGHVHDVVMTENWAKCRYAVFDILALNGKNLRDKPYSERRAVLIKWLKARKFKHIDFVQEFATIKEGWRYVKKNKLEGLVIKNPTSLYEERRSYSWLKIKQTYECVMEVLGHEEGSDKGAFLLERGSRCSALSQDYLKQYCELKATGKRVFAEIQYLNMTKNGHPFQPVLKRLITEDEINPDERRNAISERMKASWADPNSPFKTEAYKKKLSDKAKAWILRDGHPKGMLGKKHSDKTKLKLVEKRKGRRPSWKGGKRNYYQKIARKVYLESGKPWICYFCGAKDKIGIHHINEIVEDNRIENLLAVCNPCHQRYCHKKLHQTLAKKLNAWKAAQKHELAKDTKYIKGKSFLKFKGVNKCKATGENTKPPVANTSKKMEVDMICLKSLLN